MMDVRSATPLGWARYASGGTFKAAPHLLLLNRVLMAAAAGEKWASRVIVEMPPRHGKSEFISKFFPSWYLGLYPDRRVVIATNADTLSADFSRWNRDVLDAYGRDLFGVRVRHDSSANKDWRIDRRRGGMFATTIGGALTGRGADLAIIDDPIKNDREALSETYRTRNREWYRSTLRTRMEPTGAIVVVQTRWHEDDLAGWLQTEYPDEWLVVSLPAVAEGDEELFLPDDPETPAWVRPNGAALWPQRFDGDALARLCHDLGGPESHWWTALYQQRPSPLGGGILKPDAFRRYRPVEDGYLLDRPAGPDVVSATALRKFGTMDLATSQSTQADYTVMAVFGITGPDLLLLDVFRGRLEGPDLPRLAARVATSYRLSYVGVESVGFQTSTVQDMRRGNPHERPPRPPLPVKALRPEGDKVSRALTLAARMGGGQVYVPESAPWLPALFSEMAAFPHGKHDDQVDALAYGALELTHFGDNVVRTS